MSRHTLRNARIVALALVSLFASGGSVAAASPAPTPISSFSDPRSDLPSRPGQLVRALYGPYTIPAASGGSPGQIENQLTSEPVPCTNCRITDMVPNLVYSDGTTASLASQVMLHHFVMFNPTSPSLTCFASEPFFGAGNERTHLHLPSPYGYTNTSSAWSLLTHLMNLKSQPQTVYVEVIFRYRPLSETLPARPIWLDVADCNSGSVYTIASGYSDAHSDWTSTVDGHWLALSGHQHDIDHDLNPPCTNHCMNKGGAIALSAEIVGGSASEYFGPNPPTNPFSAFPGSGPTEPADLSGATLCRSEAKYGTSFGAQNGFNGHLDTQSVCTVRSDVPSGAQPEAYPAGGALPREGYPLRQGQVVRLHSEYWNNTGVSRDDVMGIMLGWLSLEPSYERPRSASPINVSLVPVFRQCGTGASPANGAHAAPFSRASCGSPATSATAHVGPQAAGTAGMTVAAGNLSTPADEADVNLSASLSDIRSGSTTGPDYNPSAGADLTLVAKWRITDLRNGTTATGAGTLTEMDFPVPVSCQASAGAEGANCNANTSADAVTPGSVPEGKAMLVSTFRLRVNDAGADGVRGNGDDRLFLQQGYHVP